MEAPKCRLCEQRHWGNCESSAPTAPAKTLPLAPKPKAKAPPSPLAATTANDLGAAQDFNRKAYQRAYMKDYMKRYRARAKVVGQG
jgi:hypothetical protein